MLRVGRLTRPSGCRCGPGGLRTAGRRPRCAVGRLRAAVGRHRDHPVRAVRGAGIGRGPLLRDVVTGRRRRRPVGELGTPHRRVLAGDAVEHLARLPVDEPGEQLLGVAEDQCVGEDLVLRVQRAQPRDELAADGEQRSERRQRAGRHLEQRQRDGDVVGRRGPAQVADVDRCGEHPAEGTHEGDDEGVPLVRAPAAGRADASVVGAEAQGQRGRAGPRQQDHRDDDEQQQRGRDEHDVAEAPHPGVLPVAGSRADLDGLEEPDLAVRRRDACRSCAARRRGSSRCRPASTRATASGSSAVTSASSYSRTISASAAWMFWYAASMTVPRHQLPMRVGVGSLCRVASSALSSSRRIPAITAASRGDRRWPR